MLLVDAINLGLHLGMPALEQDGELVQSAQSNRIYSTERLARQPPVPSTLL